MDFAVADRHDGARLDAVLADRDEIASRAHAQRLVDAGAVTVDGRFRAKGHRVRAGERIVVELAPEPPAPADESAGDRVAIAWRDEHLMVVDKPAGLVVHPAPGHPTGTLAQLLPGIGGGADPGRAGIVHRLDRDTSGLMVVARTERAHSALGALLRRRALRREYLALVDGRPTARAGTIDAPIGRDRRDRRLHSTSSDRARTAVTHFSIERRYPRTTLLRVRLDTGRTHQIRVHLAAIGLPVCGDRAYGGGACGERLGLTRQFLHSSRLEFAHPITGEQVRCESNLPVDLRHASDVAAREPVSEGPDGD